MSNDGVTDRSGGSEPVGGARPREVRRSGPGLRGGLRSMLACTPGRLLLAVFVIWCVLGMAHHPRRALDAVPLISAGQLVSEDPDAIYVDSDGGIYRPKPEFTAVNCTVLHPEMECDVFSIAFVSPPGALPFLAGLAGLGDEAGIRVLRVATLAAMGVGMVALWVRLAPLGDRARWTLAGSAVLMTPLVDLPIGLGQTTPLFFLSVVLGTGAVVGAGALGRGLLWGSTVLAKASPVVLAGVLVVQRRWRMLAWGVALLVCSHLVAAAMAGWDLFGAFVEGTIAVSDEATTDFYNGSFEAALVRAPGGGVSVELAERAGLVLRVGAAVLGAVGFFRLRDRDVQWAFAWSMWVVLLPISWWHYSLVSFGALVVAVSRTARPERWLWLVPGFLVVGMPMSIANNRAWAMPTAQALASVAAAVAIYLLGRSAGTGRTPERERDPGLAVTPRR